MVGGEILAGCAKAIGIKPTPTGVPTEIITQVAPTPAELLPSTTVSAGFTDIYYGTVGFNDITTAYGMGKNKDLNNTEVNALYRIIKGESQQVAMKVDITYVENSFDNNIKETFDKKTYTDPITGITQGIRLDKRTGFARLDDGRTLNPYQLINNRQLIPIMGREDGAGDFIYSVNDQGIVESKRALFETPGEIAKQYGFTGDPKSISRVDLNERGNLIAYTKTAAGTEVPIFAGAFLNELKNDNLIDKEVDKKLTSALTEFTNAFEGTITVLGGEKLGINDIKSKILSGEQGYHMEINNNGIETDFVGITNEKGQFVPLFVKEVDGMWNDVNVKTLANLQGIFIGTQISIPYLDDSTRLATEKLVIKEFNFGLIEGLEWWLSEKRGNKQFDFSIADNRLDIALANNMATEGNNLITPWANQSVPWLTTYKEDALKKGTPKDQIRKDVIGFMRDHIEGLMTRYKGKIDRWVVCVEVWGINDFFNDTIGEDWMDIAFQIARETNPDAFLYYNEAFNQTFDGWNYQKSKNIVNRLKNKQVDGKPLIDALGVEMHIGFGPADQARIPTKDEIIKTLKSYGIPIVVSSIDIDLHRVSGTQFERFQKQAEIMRIIFEATVDSGVCTNHFDFWEGIGDKNNWLERMESSDPDYGSKDADATIFDDNLKRKQSYYALTESIFNYLLSV